jgi:hypothetical protein
MKTLFHYYKSLLTFNFLFSVFVGFIGMIGNDKLEGLLRAFAISFLTGGFALAVFFYGLRYEHLYYFYYNKGFSKMKLIGLTYLLNITGVAILWVTKRSLL